MKSMGLIAPISVGNKLLLQYTHDNAQEVVKYNLSKDSVEK